MFLVHFSIEIFVNKIFFYFKIKYPFYAKYSLSKLYLSHATPMISIQFVPHWYIQHLNQQAD